MPFAEFGFGQAAPAFDRSGFADPAIVLRWAEIAGSEVARVTRPLRMQEGPDGAILTLVSEPAAAVFLQHETRALIERLNAFLGHERITRLRFLSAKLEPNKEPAAHPAASRPQPAKAEPTKSLAGALEELGILRSQTRAKRLRPD